MVVVAKFVKEIEVIDPDTDGVIHLAVYKHENGGMFAMDSSFVDQVAEECSAGDAVINDPFADVLPGMDLVLTEDDPSSPEMLTTYIDDQVICEPIKKQ